MHFNNKKANNEINNNPENNDIPNTSAPQLANIEESTIDIRQYLVILWKKKWVIMLFTLLVVSGVAFWTLKQPKIYKATSVVQIELEAPRVLGSKVEQVEDLGTGSYWNNQEYLRTQYKIIESREVSRRVVKMLSLDRDPDFAGTAKKNQKIGIESLIDAVRSRISVEPIKDSRLVNISVEDTNPIRAAQLSNAIAEAYLEQNVERMLSATVNALEWLSGQLGNLRGEVETTEKGIYDFKKNKNIPSGSLEAQKEIVTSKIKKLSEALTDVTIQRIELSAKLKQISNYDTNDPLVIINERIIDNSLIQELKNEYIKLKQKRAELTNTLGKNYPSVKELDSQILIVEENLKREIKNIITNAQNEYNIIYETEKGIKQSLAETEGEAHVLDSYDLDYKKLLREQETATNLYNLVLDRTKETDLARLLRVNNISILDRAIKPGAPIKPRVNLNIALALLLGLLGGIVLAFFLESLDVTIKSHEDIEKIGLNFLGILPTIDYSDEGPYYSKKKRKRRKNPPSTDIKQLIEKKDLFVFYNPKSSVAESCRAIRTNLLFSSPDKNLQSILVTSPGPQDGKTTVAVSLAIVMAQSGNKVLLIDTDMRKPRVHNAFGIKKPKTGMSTLIIGETNIEESVQKTEIENLDLLPCGPIPPNPSELLHTEKFHQIFKQLKLRYDRIIFDSPPVIAVTDAVILSTMLDGTVIVVKTSKTRKDTFKHAVRQIQEVGSNILGTVLNDLDLSKKLYYHYYYYKQYGYYYRYGEEKEDSKKESKDKDIDQQPMVN